MSESKPLPVFADSYHGSEQDKTPSCFLQVPVLGTTAGGYVGPRDCTLAVLFSQDMSGRS